MGMAVRKMFFIEPLEHLWRAALLIQTCNLSRSFLTAGCSGVYLFAYSIIYMFTKMNMTRGVSVRMPQRIRREAGES